MAKEPRLTHITALILQAVDSGFVYGFSIMEMTGLPREERPPRKYYQLTSTGKTALETSRKRYPLLQRLVPTGGARA
jgi:hypothetical protein